MRTTGEVRESGCGVLGGPGHPEYEIRVADTMTTTWTRDRASEETTGSYEVIWWTTSDPDLPLGDRLAERVFTSAAQREHFLAKMVRPQVALSPSSEFFARRHPLSELVDDDLVGVSFLSAGYVGLDFEPPGRGAPPHRGPMTFMEPPHILRSGTKLADGDAGYADGLVALIGQMVVEADEYLDLGIYIGFENGTALSRPLDGVDGPEVALFNTSTGLCVWDAK